MEQITKGRILVVDDDDEKRNSFKILLSEYNYEVNEAPDSQLALEIINNNNGNFDFILMDQYLGPHSKLDGLETTRIIKEKYPELRIIVFTEYGDKQASHKALEYGAYRYVFAPVEVREIMELMESAAVLKELERQLTLKDPENSWLKRLFDDSGFGISIIDKTYRILYANKKQQEIFSHEIYHGGICWVEYHNDIQQRGPCSGCPVKKCFETGHPDSIRQVSFINNKPQYLEKLSSPVWDESHNKIIGALYMVMDVTGREELEARLLGAENYKMRLNTALDYIIALGYRRVRLYEFFELPYFEFPVKERKYLKGILQRGDGLKDFTEIVLPINEDSYSIDTYNSLIPIIYHPVSGKMGIYHKELKNDEWLDVPIRVENKFIGKISIDNGTDAPEPLNDTNFKKLITIAEYAGHAIIERRQEERKKEEAKYIERLRKMDAEMALTQDLEKDLGTICKYAKELTGADLVHIRHFEDNKLVMKAGLGIYKELLPQVVELDDQYSGSVKAYIKKEPYIVNLVQEDPGHMERLNQINNEEIKKIKSYGSFPLTVMDIEHEKIVGVLNLQSHKEGFFNQDMVGLIDDFSRRAAIAIHNDELIIELKNALNQKMELLNRIAHSMNLPLHTIDGFISRLVKGKDHLEEERSRDYQVIFRQIKHFKRNVEDLLNLNRGEENRLKPELAKVDIVRLITDSVALFKPQADQKNIDLRINCGSDLARSSSLAGGNPVWKDIAVSPVASLGVLGVIQGYMRRQQGNRPEAERRVIEPRNTLKMGRSTVSHYSEDSTSPDEMARKVKLPRGLRAWHVTQ